MSEILSISNPVFRTYFFYCSVLGIKMLAMSLLTARQRFRKHVFISPEDTAMNPKKAVVKYDDPDIERVRRAHMNDLENIPIFLIVAPAYIASNPPAALAINLIRLFAAGRFLHTLVYAIVVIPQPARFLAFAASYGVTIYMAVVGASAFIL